jgi:putative MATE family efflux protein
MSNEIRPPAPGQTAGTARSRADSPWRSIWRLSWPQVLEMLANFLVGFADVYVAGLLNKEVQASIGLITSALFFMLIIATATANGAVAAISQSVGAGKELRARRYTGLALEIGLVCGILFVAAGFLLKDAFLALLQVPEEIRGVTSYFLEVYLLLLPAYYVIIVSDAAFRARREVLVPLYSMLIITVLNTYLDFGLGLGMFGLPRMGFKGLAWATFAAICAGALFNLAVLRARGRLERRAFPPWRWIKPALSYLARVAWPSGLMQVLWQTGYLVLFAIVAALPTGAVTAMAGMTAGLRIESILFLPGFALNMTASVLVGNALGAGRFDEAKAYAWRILVFGIVAIGLLTLGVWQAAPQLAALLSPEADVRLEMLDYLRYNLMAIPFTLTSMILGGAFVGAGATIYNLAIFGVSIWLIRLPLAWFLGHRVLGEADGVWIAQLASQAVQATALLWFFQFSDWGRFALRSRRRAAAGVPANGVLEPPICPPGEEPRPSTSETEESNVRSV